MYFFHISVFHLVFVIIFQIFILDFFAEQPLFKSALIGVRGECNFLRGAKNILGNIMIKL